uniref:Uncharacterized protein n=1 Tax=Tetranychus urticae TaxID=32264 RepID=T1KLZ5_TETUR
MTPQLKDMNACSLLEQTLSSIPWNKKAFKWGIDNHSVEFAITQTQVYAYQGLMYGRAPERNGYVDLRVESPFQFADRSYKSQGAGYGPRDYVRDMAREVDVALAFDQAEAVDRDRGYGSQGHIYGSNGYYQNRNNEADSDMSIDGARAANRARKYESQGFGFSNHGNRRSNSMYRSGSNGFQHGFGQRN